MNGMVAFKLAGLLMGAPGASLWNLSGYSTANSPALQDAVWILSTTQPTGTSEPKGTIEHKFTLHCYYTVYTVSVYRDTWKFMILKLQQLYCFMWFY